MKTAKISGYVIAISALVASAAFVFAEIPSGSIPPVTSSSPQPKQSMVLQVGPEGRTLLRGTITTVNAGSLGVKSWGGDWTVKVSATTEIVPEAAGHDLTKFKVGDYVGVQGLMNQTQAWTVDAKLVRDWTYRHEVREEKKQNIQAIHQTMKNETPRNYQGTASNVSGSTFTLTVEKIVYAVSVASNAKVLNRNFLTASLADIKNGDTVRVWGLRTNTAIMAEIVRDISLPRTNQ